ncbi:hypothetical protein E4634_06690 [Mangrovimicrobium sediminis]|uniref:DUF3187 family protein n=1 Tax=Mangrovimicrobium sediminis TaxID=2562682 RepID=A0A4Z0M5V9_9GAMM|nr:hypothetical protein [Haliea sp. SAOS-164]TGD74874.1 hypothetical protein E4634_06690 [Haliea sp. SAOS-164]
MKPRENRDQKRVVPILMSLLVAVAAPRANAEQWIPVEGRETLQALVSGATARIDLGQGHSAVGHYAADGSASIEAWGEVFQRSWRVEGENQVCYSSAQETNCFSFERDAANANRYRVRDTRDGEYTYFQLFAGQVAEASVAGDGSLGSPSAAEIAAELSNPNTAMGTLNLNLDYTAYQGDLPGAGGQESWRLLFQPSLPYPLDDTTNVFFRPAIPVVIEQDVPAGIGEFDSVDWQLGDIGFDLALGKTLPGGYVVLGGVVGTLPTATDDLAGRDQWLLGPEVALAMTRPWGVVGVLLTHQWDIAGEDDYDTNVTGGQYFYAFNLGGGWQINGTPTFSYNHEARNGDNKLSFPLGIGVSRTLLLGGRPWKFGVQYWHYVASPDDFGPDYQLRFNVSPVVALPW